MAMDPVVAEIAAGFRDVHQKLRDEVQGMDDAALAWTPAPETNSIAVLVVHTLGSEAEVFRIAAREAAPRDRDSEFRAHATADDLLARLDAADALLDELAPRIGPADLAEVRARGNRTPQTCLHWLMNNYGHAREHLAHIQLTKQVMAARQG